MPHLSPIYVIALQTKQHVFHARVFREIGFTKQQNRFYTFHGEDCSAGVGFASASDAEVFKQHIDGEIRDAYNGAILRGITNRVKGVSYKCAHHVENELTVTVDKVNNDSFLVVEKGLSCKLEFNFSCNYEKCKNYISIFRFSTMSMP